MYDQNTFRNAYDRACRDLFFNVVRKSIEAVADLFTKPTEEDLSEIVSQGRLVIFFFNSLPNLGVIGCAILRLYTVYLKYFIGIF